MGNILACSPNGTLTRRSRFLVLKYRCDTAAEARPVAHGGTAKQRNSAYDRVVDLYHCSPTRLDKIYNSGVFGSFFFFSAQPYCPSESAHEFIYSLTIDLNTIIAAGSLFYHENALELEPLVAEFCRRFQVDEDTAVDVISEHTQLYDIEDRFDADDSWECQLFTARAAKILGYRGVSGRDEQGTCYMIDMLGHFNDLTLVRSIARNPNTRRK